MIRSMLAVAMLFVGVAGAAAADTKIVYNPKYAEGGKTTIEIETIVDQVMTIAGMDIETEVEQFMIMKQVTGKQKDDGSWPVTSHFEKMQANMKLPGGLELNFDSGDPNKKSDTPELEPVLKLFRAIAQAKFTMIIAKDHKVKSIAYEGNPLEGLDEALKKEADLEQYKMVAKNELARFPKEAVKKGDTWKRTEESGLGSGQTLTFEREYKYLGAEEIDGKTYDKIGATSLTVKLKVAEDSPSPLKILSSELKVKSSEGTLFYDRELKMITKFTEKVRIQGDMKVSINGMEFPGELDLTMKSGSKTVPN